jgi:hypothetical protein
MLKLTIDGTEFVLRPENAESVREQCASIKTKGKGRKFKPGKPGLNMTRQYPAHATSTREYVEKYEQLNQEIFGGTALNRFAPLNDRPFTNYDPTQPVCVQEC